MALKDHRVEYADGEVQYFQFDTSDEAGKTQLQALKDAAESDDSNVVKVTQATPKPGEAVTADVQDEK